MPLSLITPTRRRWHWLRKQAGAIAGQLSPDDRWIIAVDNDRPDKTVVGDIARMIPAEQIVWLHCAYARPEPPLACVNRLRNAATALAPAGHDIVELDDHDLLASYALAEIRAALAAGYDYVFGWYHQQAVVDEPAVGVPSGRSEKSETTGRRRRAGEGETRREGDFEVSLAPHRPRSSSEASLGANNRDGTHSHFTPHIETWPDVQHRYQRGAFQRREIDGIGVRAIKRWLWETLGAWSTSVWPGGDYDFALRAERLGASIVCLEQPLCTVTIEPESIMAQFVRSPLSVVRSNSPLATDH